jgi:SAM-dependent methyltransferase
MIEKLAEAVAYIPDSDIRNWVGPFQDKSFYHELGLSQARKVKNWTNISESSNVLDIGCGCGRLALHFLNEIGQSGQYCGIDCSSSLVDFCTNTIAPVNSAFSFSIIDSDNGAYNPGGRLNPQTLVFPFTSQKFTAVFAWSVFTHMNFESVRNYLSESYRVLTNGGFFCFTMNLHDSHTLERINSSEAPIKMHKLGDCDSYTLNPAKPEECFSHPKDDINTILQGIGFEIIDQIEGWWSFGIPNGEYHDIVICRKKMRF